MSGGSTTQKTEPPDWAVPYIKDTLNYGTQVAAQPYTPYTGQRVAGFNPTQQTAMQAVANRAMQGSPEVSAARGSLTNTLNGGYLGAPTARNRYAGSNPYLSRTINDTMGDMVRNYNQTTAPQIATAGLRSGSFGNSGLGFMENEARRNLAQEMGKVSSGMRFQDYSQQAQFGESQAQRDQSAWENERNRMMGGIGSVGALAGQDYADAQALMGVGDALQNKQQSYLDQDYAAFTEARDYPKSQLGILQSLLGGAQSSGSSVTGPGPNKTAGTMGGALAGAQMGSSFGPYGTAIGALLGGVVGGR